LQCDIVARIRSQSKEVFSGIFAGVSTCSAIEPDDFGRRTYLLNALAERLKILRRTLQADINTLRDDGEIATGQIDGNGRPYAVLTCHFEGANKSPKADKTASPISENWGTREAPIERTTVTKRYNELLQYLLLDASIQ
jgi:hypothetical protein